MRPRGDVGEGMCRRAWSRRAGRHLRRLVRHLLRAEVRDWRAWA